MADQKRWFKVWTSILDDPDFQELSLEAIGRWTLLGALTALVGTRGNLRIGGGRRLLELLRVDTIEDAKGVILGLPNVALGRDKNDYGKVTVTWRNWRKYQVDYTVYDRVKRLRLKKGRDKKGKEVKEGDMSSSPPADGAGPDRAWAEEARQVLAFLNEKTGRAFRPAGPTLKLIEARLRSGVTLQQCRSVIMRKVREWSGDPKMRGYLRPETLFNATKFESYLGAMPIMEDDGGDRS